MKDPFLSGTEMPEELSSTLAWQKARTPSQRIAEREKITCEIEKAGKRMWANGVARNWFEGCDPMLAEVSKDVNGPLALDVAAACRFTDVGAIEQFRTGAHVFGNFKPCGLGDVRDDVVSAVDVQGLADGSFASNTFLLQSLREDEHSDALHALTVADAGRGWMTEPKAAEDIDLASLRAVPRFAVVQGEKPDGSPKIRAVDNMSWSAPADGCDMRRRRHKNEVKEASLNGRHTCVHERVKHDHLDSLMLCVCSFIELMCVVPWLLKADVASAFRRIPIVPSERWASAVAYMWKGKAYISTHNSCMFGATSSVTSWERVGRFIRSVARRVLNLALCQYVDDFFACEESSTAKHALDCLARIVDAIFGAGTLAPAKMDFGQSLIVLGVEIQLHVDHYVLKPSKAKMLKCLVVIREALARKHLPPGHAQKLAGRLRWACTHLFFRLGRAMMQPLYEQHSVPSGNIGASLHLALEWWEEVLVLGITEKRMWKQPSLPLAHLFVDASGKRGRCAAVLFLDGQRSYTDGVPSPAVMAAFNKRSDWQITTLEIMALAIGLSTFADKLRNRNVVIWSDNSGAEASTRKGSGRAWDHCRLIHDVWMLALQYGMRIWIERVPSHDNVSDCPSRLDYYSMGLLEAAWHPPVIASSYLSAWAKSPQQGVLCER